MKSARSEFSKPTKEQGWERCKERCEDCGQPFGGRRPEYHHIIAAALGGSNELTNLLVICPPCHRIRTKVENVPIFRAKRIEEKRIGVRRSKYQWPKRRLGA